MIPSCGIASFTLPLCPPQNMIPSPSTKWSYIFQRKRINVDLIIEKEIHCAMTGIGKLFFLY